MASILRVNTLTDASSNNSVTLATVSEGTVKAWTSLQSQGTFSTHDSFNQSSATDNSSGDHTTSYTNSFSSAKGSPCLGHTSNVQNTTSNVSSEIRAGTVISQHQGLTQATGSYTFQVYYGSSGSSNGNFTDLDAVWVARLGDLA
jgi:hypothetical protein